MFNDSKLESFRLKVSGVVPSKEANSFLAIGSSQKLLDSRVIISVAVLLGRFGSIAIASSPSEPIHTPNASPVQTTVEKAIPFDAVAPAQPEKGKVVNFTWEAKRANLEISHGVVKPLCLSIFALIVVSYLWCLQSEENRIDDHPHYHYMTSYFIFEESIIPSS